MPSKREKELMRLKAQRDITLKRLNELYRSATLASDDPNRVLNFSIRYDNLKPLCEEFNKYHSAIISNLASISDSDLESEEDIRKEFDDIFYSIKTIYATLVRPMPLNNPSSQPTAQVGISPTCGVKSNARLPKITLPTFSGNFKDWPMFIGLFNALVHTCTEITNIEKFQYLLSSLSKEALSVIKYVPLSENNYKIAYDALCSRYQNKRVQSTFCWQEINNAPKLISDHPQGLRNLLDIFSENLAALENLGFNITEWDFILFNILIKKLDSNTVKRFELQYSPNNIATDLPTYKELVCFLNKQCLALDSAALTVSKTSLPKPPFKPPQRPINTFMGYEDSSKKCLLCNSLHLLTHCPNFIKKNPSDRYSFCKQQNVCINCLHAKHLSRNCKSSLSCETCKRRHHTLLHFDNSTPRASIMQAPQSSSKQIIPTSSLHTSNITNSVIEPSGSASTDIVNVFTNTVTHHMVLLSTANIAVLDRHGHHQTIRVLIDSGSQSSFITEYWQRRLGLPYSKTSVPIFGLGEMSAKTSGTMTCQISPLEQPSQSLVVDCIILPKLDVYLPSKNVCVENWDHISNLKLADENFHHPGPIGMLLGADVFPLIFRNGCIKGKNDEPTAINTIFGWIIMGKVKCQNPPNGVNSFFISLEENLDNIIKKFWEVEEVPSKLVSSPDDLLCEKIYTESHYRTQSGRYVVNLPFRHTDPSFHNSRNMALRRFHSLERRLLHNPSLYEAYCQFMKDYLECGHMEPVTEPFGSSDKGYFIPHHCVIKPDSRTTKLRVVFDASAKASGEPSLNETLLTGQKLQQDIFCLLLNFRLHPVVFTADIKQMYRQILVSESHRKYQKIFWRFSLSEPIQEFRLNTVTYGVSSAPFLALRTLLQLAKDEASKFPKACEVLMESGFEFRKWASNECALLQSVCPGDCQQDALFFDSQDTNIKILGLKWLPSFDSFSYSCETFDRPCTKRSILSELARIFDPQGFLSPVSFFCKNLLQHLWATGLDWDDAPSESIVHQWTQFKNELPILNELKIPRRLMVDNFLVSEIHGFCDSSERGYACVVYFRFILDENNVKTFFVTAKSKIAPLKRISIPRLELCGAVLLGDVLNVVLNTFSGKIHFNKIYAWSDSMVCLAWIKNSPHRWKTFVSNRVTQIQSKIAPAFWHYVPSKENPADCASRGLLPSELLHCSLWWAGPSWLHSGQEIVVPSMPDLSNTSEEEKPFVFSTFTPPDMIESILNKYSSLQKIQRIIGLCFRFISNCKKPENKTVGALSISELNEPLKLLIKLVQNQSFSEDISRLQNRKLVSKPLRKLNPFLDEECILRVGGRLANSQLPFNQKHPMLLPRDSRLTRLIIEQTHRKHLHCGLQTLHFVLLQNYWILSPKRAIRSVIGSCYKCFRVNPPLVTPQMGNLPPFRVAQVKAFTKVGLDMAGPFSITMSRVRKAKVLKAYLCLFVCCATKAVHLELCSDLSSQAFLAGLRRFISRRGRCTHIYSDCGSNFIGANKYLRHLMESVVDSEQIIWNFNPPAAPHFGGLWESGIKSVKSHLIRVIGEQVLTYEELNTVFIQIEALLNSRPLTPISSDPNDLTALTPGLFLSLEPLKAIPDEDLTDLNLNRLSRWQLLIHLQQCFWKRWHQEYLNTLTLRHKWHKTIPDIKPGVLVVLKNELAPPLQWRLGRILEVHPGSDGITRVVTVKTTQGIFQRPVVKICPLPLQ